MSGALKHILVSERQRGNPLLEHIRNVPWRYATTPQTPDYILGDRNCALFISVRYHLLKPQSSSRAEIAPMNRGDAAAVTSDIPRRRVAAAPRLRAPRLRAGSSRGGDAARADASLGVVGSRLRRGRDVDTPRRRVAAESRRAPQVSGTTPRGVEGRGLALEPPGLALSGRRGRRDESVARAQRVSGAPGLRPLPGARRAGGRALPRVLQSLRKEQRRVHPRARPPTRAGVRDAEKVIRRGAGRPLGSVGPRRSTRRTRASSRTRSRP